MFSLVTGLYDSYLSPTKLNILIVGPPGSGKTALLERLKATQLPKRARSSSSTTSNIQAIPQSVAKALVETSGVTPLNETTEAGPGGAMADLSSSIGTTNNNTSGAIAASHAKNPTNSRAESAVALLPPIIVTQKKRRLFPISICPAPDRYRQAAAVGDDDEEYVYEDDDGDDVDENDSIAKNQVAGTKANEEGEADANVAESEPHQIQQHDSSSNCMKSNLEDNTQTTASNPNDGIVVGRDHDENTMIEIPLDTPISPTSNAPSRLRLHSRELSVESLDLSNEDVNKTSKKERKQKKKKQQEEAAVAEEVKTNSGGARQSKKSKSKTGNASVLGIKKNGYPLYQDSDQSYDLKPRGKLLSLSKIRPTIGTNLAKLEVHGAMCHFFDVGGKMQNLWQRYYSDCDAVIFCWKLEDDPNSESDRRNEDDDDDEEPPYDMKQQQDLLHQVRQSIPDDVPFMILTHVFGNAHEGIVNRLYNTTMLLPRYHNPITAMCCGSAKNGAGIVFALDWLVPLAKRLQKERGSRDANQPPKEVD